MPASTPRPRRKAPDSVRQALLLATAQTLGRDGLAALTVQEIARMAGVSKGALFHHFSSKQALIEATLHSIIAEFEGKVREAIRQSPSPHGRFSRAYVQVNFQHLLQQEQINDLGLSMGNLLEPALLEPWRAWLRGMLAEFADEACDPRLYAARCVADGYWTTAYGRPLDEDERRNAQAMAQEALKLCEPA